jgi:NAD(P)-dependent dehydrogenase (short-subunit alcohol dehydrogenase family)
MERRNATVAVIGAGDYIGAAISKKFAAKGYTVFAGRRTADKLKALESSIREAGGECIVRGLDARKQEAVTGFLQEADRHAPLEVCVFNVGANVQFPVLDTTERVFRKVWEMACYSGFLAGREAARLMLAHGKGTIFFTGATASLRGGKGYVAFASAKFGLRAVAQSMARELGPQNIHVAPGDRRWRRHGVRPRSNSRCGRRSSRPINRARPAHGPSIDRRRVLVSARATARRMDVRARPSAAPGVLVRGWQRLTMGSQRKPDTRPSGRWLTRRPTGQ